MASEDASHQSSAIVGCAMYVPLLGRNDISTAALGISCAKVSTDT